MITYKEDCLKRERKTLFFLSSNPGEGEGGVLTDQKVKRHFFLAFFGVNIFVGHVLTKQKKYALLLAYNVEVLTDVV